MLRFPSRLTMLAVLSAGAVLMLAAQSGAQSGASQSHVIGSVPVTEASATGALAISGGKNLLGGASVVTAYDKPAHVTLFRGGDLLVCQTSVARLTSGGHALRLVGNEEPMVLALDRGAMELRMAISRDDALITPDLRFTSADTRDKAAPLNLALRVTPNGDTCVDNRGKKAPTLNITDAFGQASYQLKAGQHVLFEHGSLKEVVDTETSSCGCPPPAGMSLAEAALRGGSNKKKKKGDPYPFPAAVSEGLASPGPVPPEKPGETHIQVSGTLTYNPAAADPTAAPATNEQESAAITAAEPPVTVTTPAQPAQTDSAPKHGALHSVGHFFKKIFAR